MFNYCSHTEYIVKCRGEGGGGGGGGGGGRSGGGGSEGELCYTSIITNIHIKQMQCNSDYCFLYRW